MFRSESSEESLFRTIRLRNLLHITYDLSLADILNGLFRAFPLRGETLRGRRPTGCTSFPCSRIIVEGLDGRTGPPEGGPPSGRLTRKHENRGFIADLFGLLCPRRPELSDEAAVWRSRA